MSKNDSLIYLDRGKVNIMVSKGILVCPMFFFPGLGEPPVWALKGPSFVKSKKQKGTEASCPRKLPPSKTFCFLVH